MQRQRIAALVAGVSILAAGGGWFAGSRITSPADARASAEAPPASLITAPVERRTLSSNLVLRGDLAFEESTAVALGGSWGADAVVTKSPPAVGSDLVEGQVLVEVSGRPVMVLQGDLPVFRTLGVGVTGDDVAQLESALQRLGLRPGPVDTIFDAATQAAVAGLYRQRGYTTREASKEQRDALVAAQSAASSARESLRFAQKAVREDGKGTKESERLALDDTVAGAEASLAQARVAATRAAAEGSRLIAAADAELAQAVAARDVAVARLAEAQAPGALDPATGEPFAPSAVGELRNAVSAADGQIAAKRAGVQAAKDSAGDTVAERRLAVEAAQRSLAIAVAARNEGLAGRPTTESASALAEAERNVAQADQRLAEATAAAGVTVPSGELIFLKSLPRRIDAAYLERGQRATGTVVDVSGAELNITTSVGAADRSLIRAGTEVQISEDNLDVKLTGVVASVADQPGSGGAAAGGGSKGSGNGDSGSTGSGGAGRDSERYRVVITPAQLPTDIDVTELRGVNFKLTIPVKSTTGQVLAVPVAALSATSDGGTRVEVEVQGTRTRFVAVRKGLAAQGYVEVSAEGSGRLSEGDQVVVGR